MRHSVALLLSISTLAMASTTNDTLPLTFKYPTVPAPFPTIHHPFPPRYNGSTKIVPTNAWLSNLFYPSTGQMAPITSDPYTLRFLDGNGNGVSVVQKQEKIVGGYPTMNNLPATEAGYLLNQVVVDLRLSGQEWLSPPDLTVIDWDHFGATVQLTSPQNNNASFLQLPVARGMAYVTAHYHALTPRLSSQHVMLRIDATQPPTSSNQTVYYTGTRFKIAMNDPLESTWLIYCLDGPLTFAVVDASTLVATAPYTGTLRVAKLPRPLDEAVLDQHHDVWTTGGTIEPHESAYTIRWHVQGQPKDPLLYAYPHHLETLTASRTPLRLESATKGTMYAVRGSTWHLQEDPIATTWFPQQSHPDPSTQYDILQSISHELEHSWETNKADTYFSGKALQKYALLALLVNKPEATGLRNPEMAHLLLDRLKASFAVFLENRQQDPFLYDGVYRGIVSRNGLPVAMGGTGDSHAAFGHAYYNDHHYHQGYLIVTAAVIHYLDPKWRRDELRLWTDSLIRDVNDPTFDDNPTFAPYRQWDWFAGHTWAGGIKVHGAMDGRDQESVPEAVNFYWGMKLWGLATDAPNLVHLANLQLAIMKRTTYAYFWMLNSNRNRPVGLVMNKVVGILFEQKMDYTTYFGRYMEYIHGIQQLPMTPILADVFRTPEFVQEEWDQKLAAIVPHVKSAWAGVLNLNYALINPSDAYQNLKKVEMDDGQTRAYSLYLAATRPGFHRRALSRVVAGLSPQQHQSQERRPTHRINLSHNQHDDRYNGY